MNLHCPHAAKTERAFGAPTPAVLFEFWVCHHFSSGCGALLRHSHFRFGILVYTEMPELSVSTVIGEPRLILSYESSTLLTVLKL
jgi:hypothetical protein